MKEAEKKRQIDIFAEQLDIIFRQGDPTKAVLYGAFHKSNPNSMDFANSEQPDLSELEKEIGKIELGFTEDNKPFTLNHEDNAIYKIMDIIKPYIKSEVVDWEKVIDDRIMFLESNYPESPELNNLKKLKYSIHPKPQKQIGIIGNKPDGKLLGKILAKKQECKTCSGSGLTTESPASVCPNCNGKGTFPDKGNSTGVTFCSKCYGSGYILKQEGDKCPYCGDDYLFSVPGKCTTPDCPNVIF